MKAASTIALLAMTCATTGCVQMNSAGKIRNIGQQYNAALVEKVPHARLLQSMPENKPVRKACQADGKVYIEARMARIRKLEPWFRDAAFSQLPHGHFECITKPGEVCYYCDGSILTEKPAGAVDTTAMAQPSFFTVSPAWFSKNQYQTLWIQERPNPHRSYTVPLSWLAAVVIDIPGSIVATTVMLPCEIYSVIFD